MIANLYIIETLEAHAALKTLPHFSHIFLLMAQGTHITFKDHIGATVEAYFCVTAQFTFGNLTSCHLTKLGRSKNL